MTPTQAPKDTALLPCPYCKSAVRMRRESGVTGKVCRSRFYRERVVCTNENCRASGPVGKSPNSTVARWNRFAAPKTDALDPSTALVQSNRERDQAREALEVAAHDLKVIQTLNSHGASDRTYIDWLRANAAEAERRARAVLSSLPSSSSKEEGD